MSTTTCGQKKTDAQREKAALIGIDGDGDRHYVIAPTTTEGHLVLVETDDGVEEFDLDETPCADQDDTIEAWISHVETKRGSWEYIGYERSIVDRLEDGGL